MRCKNFFEHSASGYVGTSRLHFLNHVTAIGPCLIAVCIRLRTDQSQSGKLFLVMFCKRQCHITAH